MGLFSSKSKANDEDQLNQLIEELEKQKEQRRAARTELKTLDQKEADWRARVYQAERDLEQCIDEVALTRWKLKLAILLVLTVAGGFYFLV